MRTHEQMGYVSSQVLQAVKQTVPSICIAEFVPQTPHGHAALQVVREVRKASSTAFICVWSTLASHNAALRLVRHHLSFVFRRRVSLRR